MLCDVCAMCWERGRTRPSPRISWLSVSGMAIPPACLARAPPAQVQGAAVRTAAFDPPFNGTAAPALQSTSQSARTRSVRLRRSIFLVAACAALALPTSAHADEPVRVLESHPDEFPAGRARG